MGNDNCGENIDVFELLPNMIKYKDETIVIKYGGNAMFDQETKLGVIKDIVFLKMIGMRPVIVHGGGPAINEHMKRVGLKPEFVEGHRKTNEDTLEIVEMVLCGKVNNELVKLINQEGAKAIGLSGKDASWFVAREHKRWVRKNGKRTALDLGQVGEVESIDPEIFDILTEHEIIPVIAPIGVGEDDTDYNINADVLAGEIARALKAKELIYLTNVDGICQEPEKPDSRIENLTHYEARGLLNKTITGGMLPKVESCLKAIENGLDCAHIIDGNVEHALLYKLLTNVPSGTTIERDLDEE